jgi:serine phosphatase RsbU (regulator of sigma subunit)
MEVWGGNTQTNNGVSMLGLDAWVYSRPYQSAEAGGDVYYVSSCATGRITRLLVADVSGHGNAVRETAGVLRNLMRRYVNHLDQRHFVRSMNKQFTELSAAGCFATAVVTTFFGPTNYLTLCNAGHPTPLMYRAKSREWSLLARSHSRWEEIANIPLGIEDITDYQQMAVQLEVGDLVLCYSDSLIESHDSSGQMLGESGLLAIARQVDGSDAQTVAPKLLEKITALAPGNLEGDDVTVLLFRPNGVGRAGYLTRALAPIRVLGAAVGALFGSGKPVPLPDMSLPNIGGLWFARLNRLWGGKRA